eukprot:gene20902-25098_t
MHRPFGLIGATRDDLTADRLADARPTCFTRCFPDHRRRSENPRHHGRTGSRKVDGSRCSIVEMDGFHLANRELDRLGRHERKGAPDTFDVDGYAALLRRLRASNSTVYAPVFDREFDESIGSTTAVDPCTPLIVTEGNYLLLPSGGWQEVRAALDEVWYLDVPEETRTKRLVKRHSRFGKSSEAAAEWVKRVDQPNAELISAVRPRADLIVRIERTAAGSEKSGQAGNSGDSAEYRRQCTGDGDNAVE